MIIFSQNNSFPSATTELEIRRLTTKQQAVKKNKSAEADHRRRAVIAAAEAREKAHKVKSKPIKQVTKTTLAREKRELQLQQQQQQQLSIPAAPQSEAARQAAAAAKQGEAQLAQQLGYNPYEPSRATAGQARTATTATQHGSLSADQAGDHLPSVAAPSNPTEAVAPLEEFPPSMAEAYATLLSATSEDTSTRSGTCKILAKLITNATTKGQQEGTPDSAKFRKIRLANPKIQSSIVQVSGALETLMAVGFLLQEQEGESVLIYPESNSIPSWIPSAIQQLEQAAAATSS